MSRLPSTYIITNDRVPYHQQPPLKYCGHFQIKAMLHYYKNEQLHYKQCCSSSFAKHIGLMSPHGLATTLNKYGLPSKYELTHHLSPYDRLSYIKERLLNTDGPHITMVARLYNAQGKFRDVRTRKLFYHHYVSVWGYDDTKKEIYLYDATRTAFPNSNQLPTGNFVLPYDYFLHCRKRGGVQILNFSMVSIL